MAAGAAPGTELCPHCRRPFKRLRAHLPHCKAAPTSPPAPGNDPRPAPPAASPDRGPNPAGAPGTAPGRSPQPCPASGSIAGPSAATAPRPGPGTAAPRSRSRAVRDVARSLDLHPEEVEDVPRMLQRGVKVVIEKHRARVVREKEPRSRGEGTDPGPDPHPQPRKTAQKSKSKETRSQAAVGSGSGSSKGGKSSLKATKALQEPPESRNSRGALVQQEGRDKRTAGEELVHLEVVGGSKPPVPALHPKNLHLSLAEAFGGHSPGPSKNELSRLQRPRGGGEGAPEPIVSPALLHTPQIRPLCSPQAAGRSATGLEWFPDLYPDYEGLRIFPGKRFHEDVRVTAESPKGGFAQGQRGNKNLPAGICWEWEEEGVRNAELLGLPRGGSREV